MKFENNYELKDIPLRMGERERAGIKIWPLYKIPHKRIVKSS